MAIEMLDLSLKHGYFPKICDSLQEGGGCSSHETFHFSRLVFSQELVETDQIWKIGPEQRVVPGPKASSAQVSSGQSKQWEYGETYI